MVGGGYCGLSAATELARRGRRAVVLDAHDLGWGASTRNGGMVLPELKAGPRTLERRYGELGLRLHAEVVEAAFDHVEKLIADQGDRLRLRAQRPALPLPRRPLRRAHLDALAEELTSIGSAAHVVRGDELAAEIGSTLFPAGLVVERSGGLHPARFHAGLTRCRRSRRVPPSTRTPRPPRSGAAGSRWHVTTPSGVIDADEVLVATNAYADALVPALRRRVLPMGSFIIATEPLDPDARRRGAPHAAHGASTTATCSGTGVSTTTAAWSSAGGSGSARVGLEEARDHLYASMLEVHPQLAGVRVERAWGGNVALTLDRLPHCGRIDGLWYATGCNGSGVALNTWLGHRMAAAIAASPSHRSPSCATAPSRCTACGEAGCPLVSAWFRFQDRRG